MVRPLRQLIPEADATVDIVDIGASPIDGAPPYKPLLDSGRARVAGFEPNPEAFAELERRKGKHETYYPHAIGDGGTHTLHFCRAPGMNSLLTPNPEVLRQFHGFEQWGTVLRTEPVQTVRLDDVAGIANIDMLKIDIQGYELEVFRHGATKLSQAVLIQTEVEFVSMYQGQPLFWEVAQFLATLGFVLHRFAPLKSRVVRPMLVGGNIYAGMSQVIDADAVFIKDFSRFDSLPPPKLLALATLLNDLYGSFDVALAALAAFDRQRGTQLGARYLRMSGAGSA